MLNLRNYIWSIQKKFRLYNVQFNSKALKNAKYKIRKIRIRKAICTVIRKATVLKRRKFGIIFNEQFDTIVYCIVSTVYAVLAGINLVISEAAC